MSAREYYQIQVVGSNFKCCLDASSERGNYHWMKISSLATYQNVQSQLARCNYVPQSAPKLPAETRCKV